MQPCVQEEKIKHMTEIITKLQLSDAEKNIEIKNLVKSIDALIGWIKLFIGTTLASIISMVIAYLKG